MSQQNSPQPNVHDPICPSRSTLEIIANKWSMLIIMQLSRGAKRNGQLKRNLGDVSQKVLTTTLRQLEQSGIVERKIYPQIPPKVEYHLTDLGFTLLEPIQALADWAEDNFVHVIAARNEGARS